MSHSLLTSVSPFSVKETCDKLESVLLSKSIRVFARINHAKAAQENAMELRDEEVLIFGDPKVGTFLMQESPAIGIELPLKILVWQEQQITKVAYRDPRILADEYGIKIHLPILEKLSGVLSSLVKEIIAN